MNIEVRAKVLDLLEEAHQDLKDALELSLRRGAEEMALWHANQAVEKMLRAVASGFDRKVSVMWGVEKVMDAIKDVEGMGEIEGEVKMVVGSKKEEARRVAGVVATTIRAKILKLLEFEESEFEEIVVPSSAVEEREEKVEVVSVQKEAAPQATADEDKKTMPFRKPIRDRKEEERRTSYVAKYLMCEHCGVRLPRKYQSAKGKVPCPHCGRAMVLVE
jgi:HEPN domain-containing protein/predicted RNA-binding Zn-ribbon protein involved in translation (DUF1610 family)